MGSPLTAQDLAIAYRMGIFPMGEDDGSWDWYESRQRALLPIEGIRVSRSLRRTIRRGRFEIRFDTSFEQVMRGCRRPDGNWINEELIAAFTEAFRAGWAHCSETWREGRLVGGAYGLAIGTCFSAESMFHRETDASKVALWALVERCRDLGFELFDAQVMNPHLASLGAYCVGRAEYHRLLKRAVAPGKVTAWSV